MSGIRSWGRPDSLWPCEAYDAVKEDSTDINECARQCQVVSGAIKKLEQRK